MENDQLLKHFVLYQQNIKNEIKLEINNFEHILSSSDSSSSQIINSFRHDLVSKKILFENNIGFHCDTFDKNTMKTIILHCNCFIENMNKVD